MPTRNSEYLIASWSHLHAVLFSISSTLDTCHVELKAVSFAANLKSQGNLNEMIAWRLYSYEVLIAESRCYSKKMFIVALQLSLCTIEGNIILHDIVRRSEQGFQTLALLTPPHCTLPWF